MPRKEAMRSREVSKRGRVAEREDGASPAARRALRDRLPLASLPCEASQSSLPPQSAGGKTEAAHRSDVQKVAESNRWTLCRHWGAPQSGRGHAERATSALVFASDMVHTGGFVRDGKASGQEAREPPTQRQRLHGESAGA